MSAAVDLAAEALGRARAAHERAPGVLVVELAFERARASFFEAALRQAEESLRTERARRAELRGEMARLRREFASRLAAVIAKAAPKRKAGRPAAAPLFEGFSA